MLQYSFDLFKKTPRNDGKFPLKVKIYRSRTDYVFIGLKIYLLAEQWDGDKVVNTIEANNLNSRLNFYRLNIGKVLLHLDEEGGTAPMAEVRNLITEAIGKKIEVPKSFFPYFEAHIASITAKKTRESFRLALSKVKKFDPMDKSFSAITVGWLRNFERFCLDGGMAVNAISIYIRNIRTVFNRAIDDGVAQLNDYPFRRFKIKQETTRKRSLTIDQIRQIKYFPCEPWQVEYRDIFMLIIYLRGINMIDLFNLSKIENGYVHYRRSKTKRLYSVKIEPEALEIIERYRGRKHLLNIADRYKDHANYLQHINHAIQSLGWEPEEKHKASKPGPASHGKGIFPDVTTYWARHTWATIAAKLDIPKETIAAGLGHEIGNRVTSIYIDLDQDKIDQANRKVIDEINKTPT